MPQVNAVYQTLVDVAIEATGATSGWLLRLDGSTLTVVAAAGDGAAARVGGARPIAGAAGHAATSGQAAALRLPAGDDSNHGAGAHPTTPTSVLAVPCVGEDVVGVIELADADGGFTFDHVEVVGLLSDVAAAALVELGAVAPQPPPSSPAELGGRLETLAATDPGRYADVARMLSALLAATPAARAGEPLRGEPS